MNNGFELDQMDCEFEGFECIELVRYQDLPSELYILGHSDFHDSPLPLTGKNLRKGF